MENVIAFLQKHCSTPLPAELIETLEESLKKQPVKKNEYLLYPHQKADKVYFIEKGLFRVYRILEDDREVNEWFLIREDVMYGVNGIITGEVKNEGIEALEPSIVYYISKNLMNKLIPTYPGFAEIERKLKDKYRLMESLNNEIRRQSTAEAQVRMFRKVYSSPHPYNIIQKHIASFLDMNPAYLSDILNAKKSRKIKKSE